MADSVDCSRLGLSHISRHIAAKHLHIDTGQLLQDLAYLVSNICTHSINLGLSIKFIASIERPTFVCMDCACKVAFVDISVVLADT